MRILVGLILLVDGRDHRVPIAPPSLDDVEIGLATIAEYAGLNVVITLLGIVVEVGETLLRHIVVADVVLHHGAVVVQRVADVGGEGQTDVAVYLGLLVEHGDGHGTQGTYQGVVAGNVGLHLCDKRLERQLLALEVVILLGGLMTGVGEVEHVVLFLGIEHQRVLVRTLHDVYQLIAYLFVLLAVLFYHLRQLTMVVGKLCAQYLQRLGQVFLFQYGMTLQSGQKCQ